MSSRIFDGIFDFWFRLVFGERKTIFFFFKLQTLDSLYYLTYDHTHLRPDWIAWGISQRDATETEFNLILILQKYCCIFNLNHSQNTIVEWTMNHPCPSAPQRHRSPTSLEVLSVLKRSSGCIWLRYIDSTYVTQIDIYTQTAIETNTQMNSDIRKIE